MYANASRVERGLGVSEAYFSSWADTGDQVEKEVATNYELGFHYEANNFSFGVEVFDSTGETEMVLGHTNINCGRYISINPITKALPNSLGS